MNKDRAGKADSRKPLEVRSLMKWPRRGKGKLDIYVEMVDGHDAATVIIGDPKGLRYLASLLTNMADIDQNRGKDVIGSREHIHLHRNVQLGSYSCEVEICRADAKGTGELPDFMR
jgi:hypothetical protein